MTDTKLLRAAYRLLRSNEFGGGGWACPECGELPAHPYRNRTGHTKTCRWSKTQAALFTALKKNGHRA